MAKGKKLMKNALVLLSCICIFVVFSTSPVSAKYPENATYADALTEKYSASSVLTDDEETEVEEDEAYPDRVIYATGTVQIFMAGCWYIKSDDPNLKIWVWNWSSSISNKKGGWRPVAKEEVVSQENSVVRIEIDEAQPYQVDIYYLAMFEQETTDWFDCEIRADELNFFTKVKNKFNQLKGKNFSFELVSGSESAIISLRAMAQHKVISDALTDEDGKLHGFIVTDSRGFLDQFIEFDQEKMEKNPAYKKSTLNKLNEIVIRDDQFFIAVYN